MKKWLLMLGLLAAAAGVFLYIRWSGEREVPHYRTVPAAKGSVSARVTATGTLSALVTVQVGTQVSGRIQELLADFNSKVEKGEVIARIDPLLFKAAEEQARANLVAAQSNLVKAQVEAKRLKRQLERAEALFEGALVAQAELDKAQAEYDAAAATVEAVRGSVMQARANHNQTQVNLSYTQIVSPIDGVVISRAVDVGQTVAATLQAPTIFTIAEDLTRMQVDTYVAEADIGKLEPGLEATFTVDAYPYRSFVGKVRQIRNAPTTLSNVVTYDVVIDVENPGLELKPGMTATVTIVHARAADVLLVPNQAFRFRPAEAPLQVDAGARAGRGSPRAGEVGKELRRRSIFVLREGKPVELSLAVGITDGANTQIVEGELKEGDAVILENLGALPGAPAPRPQGARMPRL